MTLPQFLELMNGDLQNEWTHLQFYLYHASAASGLHAHEYKEFLTESAQGEMQHVQAFLDRLFGLNYAQPCQDAKPFVVASRVEDIIIGAIKLEEEVVRNYAQRIAQLDGLMINNPVEASYLKIFYEDQLQDSYEDCEHLRRILKNVTGVIEPRKTGD